MYITPHISPHSNQNPEIRSGIRRRTAAMLASSVGRRGLEVRHGWISHVGYVTLRIGHKYNPHTHTHTHTRYKRSQVVVDNTTHQACICFHSCEKRKRKKKKTPAFSSFHTLINQSVSQSPGQSSPPMPVPWSYQKPYFPSHLAFFFFSSLTGEKDVYINNCYSSLPIAVHKKVFAHGVIDH